MEESNLVTAEGMVEAALKKLFAATARWYQFNTDIMGATDNGRTMFMWRAVYDSGDIFYQYDPITFYRALTDPKFIPSTDRIISTKGLDRSKVVEFSLYPIAYISSKCPYFQRSYRVVIRPDKGEYFIYQWSVDVNMTTGQKVIRTMIGIQNGFEVPTYFAISPSGALAIAQTENLSFEGE